MEYKIVQVTKFKGRWKTMSEVCLESDVHSFQLE